jgi:membrane fusion protein, multidrug efflux system
MSPFSNTGKKGKTVAIVLLILGAVIILTLAGWFIHHRMDYAVTDAVFVRTDSLATLGFDRVSGRVLTMRKKAGDPVSAGEVIATIDRTPYLLAARRLEAQIREIRETRAEKKLLLARVKKEIELNVKIARARVEQLKKQKDALDAKAASVQAVIEQLKRDRKRFEALYRARAVAKRKAEDICTQLAAQEAKKRAVMEDAAAISASMDSARLSVRLAEAKRTQIGEVRKSIRAKSEKIASLTAALEDARTHIDACALKSPIRGRIAKRYASAGDIVSPASAIYAVLDPKDLYIVALMSEDKLAGVVPGAPVRIRIDAYPDEKYRGVVTQVLPASAATFALAPRDISAGEFTKVAQRVPVRIRFTGGDTGVLQVGLSGDVEIRRERG